MEDYVSEADSTTFVDAVDGAITYVYEEDQVKRISNLDIEIKAGSLKILESEDEQIHLIIDDGNGTVKEGIEGDTFIVEDTSAKVWDFLNGRKGIEVILYLPPEMTFEQISIDVNAGEVDTSGVELTAMEAELSVDAGSLKAGTLTAVHKAEADTGAGGDADRESCSG